MSIKQRLLARLPVDGDRIRIRLFEAADITEDYVGWLNNPDVVRYSNQRFRMHDRTSCETYFAGMRESSNLFVVIETSFERRTIGTLTVHLAEPHGTADLGIMIGDKTCWGQGLGQDAWNTAIRWVFSDHALRKITAGTSELNQGMLKLIEKAKMHREGIREAQEIIDGTPRSIHLYARFNDQ